MSFLLKDIFSPEHLSSFADHLRIVYPPFNKEEFLEKVFIANWKNLELKQRMRQITISLHEFLPDQFEEAAAILVNLIHHYNKTGIREKSIEHFFLPDYIEVYGTEHFDASVQAMEVITQFTSCEFAVRPLILKYGDRMVQQMTRWASHKSEKVRRLASEGIRPRLPWAMALPALKKDPAPILPILELLKNDPSEFVRRSVANNLNDITKDNPEVVMALLPKWKGISKETDALLKHACRSLLKKGDKTILSHFDLEHSDCIEVTDFSIEEKEIKMEDEIHFSFRMINNNDNQKVIRLEYAIYFQKQNGSLNKKVFKISERPYKPFEVVQISRKHSFRYITTRKYHPGLHKISLITNGCEHGSEDFYLMEKEKNLPS